MKWTLLLVLLTSGVFAASLKPFSKLGIQVRGVAPLGMGNILVLAEDANALVLNARGEVIKSHTFTRGFNRAPVAFPGGGAMGVTIAPNMMGNTDFIFFNEQGELIKKRTFPGLSPAVLKLEENGLIQGNPVGRALYFNSQGEVIREEKYPSIVFYTPVYKISEDIFFAATGEVKDRSMQFDSFFNLGNEVQAQSHRSAPSFSPVVLEDGQVIVTRWNGEIIVYDGKGKVLDFDLADDFIVQSALSLDGIRFWVATVSTTALLEMDGDAMSIVGSYPAGLDGMVKLDENHVMGTDGTSVIVLDQRKIAQGAGAVVKKVELELQGNDFLYGVINKISKDTFVVSSRGGSLFKINL